jgi:hypothetical protein
MFRLEIQKLEFATRPKKYQVESTDDDGNECVGDIFHSL